MKDTTELFDLDAFAAAGADDPRLVALAPAIRQAVSMSSVRNDLRRSEEMLAACKSAQQKMLTESRQGKSPSRADAAVVQALFMQAVLLYARATHSSGVGRNKLQITNHLSASGRTRHDQITGLRDRYLAHFGEPGDWERHRAILALDVAEGQMALSYPHEGYYVRAEEAHTYEALLKEAATIAEEAYAKASRQLNGVINRLFDECPDLLERLRRAPFEPQTFFDLDEVAAYLASIGSRDPDAPTSPRIIDPAPA